MTQNDCPNPADIGGEKLTSQELQASPPAPLSLLPAPPSPLPTAAPVTLPPEPPANPKPAPRAEAAAPDPFAVGVRVLRMAPAWMLAATAGCSVLIVLLGWMNPGGMSNAVAYAPAPNDARPARTSPHAGEARTAAPARPAEAAQPAKVSDNAVPEPEVPQAAAPPVVERAAPPPAVEPAAAGADAGGNFTVQVGSFNNPSEANERVSGLRGAGFEARAVAAEIAGRGTWYRVQVGRFADRAEAAKAVAALREKGAAAAIVVPLQN